MSGATEPPLGPFNPQASDLCLACGLCCDGTIYGQVRLRADELGLAADGLELVDQNHETFFRLGCLCLEGTACRIYGKRPETCRTFRCALLARLDSGDTELTAALAIVAEAKRLADRADNIGDPTEDRGRARQRWHRQFGALVGGGEREPVADPAWLLAMTALNRFLDRHFRKPHQRQIREDDGRLRPEAEERD